MPLNYYSSSSDCDSESTPIDPYVAAIAASTNDDYLSDCDSESTPIDPHVAAITAASDENDEDLVDQVEVTGPIEPMPFDAHRPQVIPLPQIPPVRQQIMELSAPIATVPISYREMEPLMTSTPPVNKQKRQRIGEWEPIDRRNIKKNMDWLPTDWLIRTNLRVHGTSAGRIDYDYIDPEGLRFRSKKEVVAYRKHGILPARLRAGRRKLLNNVIKTEKKKPVEDNKNEVREKGWL